MKSSFTDKYWLQWCCSEIMSLLAVSCESLPIQTKTIPTFSILNNSSVLHRNRAHNAAILWFWQSWKWSRNGHETHKLSCHTSLLSRWKLKTAGKLWGRDHDMWIEREITCNSQRKTRVCILVIPRKMCLCLKTAKDRCTLNLRY